MKPKYLTLIPATAAVLLLSGCVGKPERQFSLELSTVGKLECKVGESDSPAKQVIEVAKEAKQVFPPFSFSSTTPENGENNTDGQPESMISNIMDDAWTLCKEIIRAE